MTFATWTPRNDGTAPDAPMKNKEPQWGIMALLAVIALLLGAFVLPPLPKPKARASRIQAVNHVASVSWMLPNTNAPTATRNK